MRGARSTAAGAVDAEDSENRHSLAIERTYWKQDAKPPSPASSGAVRVAFGERRTGTAGGAVWHRGATASDGYYPRGTALHDDPAMPFVEYAGVVPPTPTPSYEHGAARRIQRCWTGLRCRTFFGFLKQTLAAAEQSDALDLIRKLSPSDASLLIHQRDTVRVRFRLSGSKFPPFVVYKIYAKGSAWLRGDAAASNDSHNSLPSARAIPVRQHAYSEGLPRVARRPQRAGRGSSRLRGRGFCAPLTQDTRRHRRSPRVPATPC